MADDRKQVGAAVDPDVWQAFREDVKDRRGGVRGKLGEELDRALRAYIDASHGGDVTDRLARVESRLDRVVEAVENSGGKKQDSGVSATVENRLQKIRETIEEASDGAPRVHEDVVEMAIKQVAGKSRPTLRQYKDLLTDERDLFPDPRETQAYYYRDAAQFAVAVNSMYEDDREIGAEQYADLVDETYGRDWWGDRIAEWKERNGEETTDDERGFQ